MVWLASPCARPCTHLAFRLYETQIHFIVVQNRQGKTRLAKWYSSYDDGEKQKILTDVHRIVTSRSPKFTNFVEAR